MEVIQLSFCSPVSSIASLEASLSGPTHISGSTCIDPPYQVQSMDSDLLRLKAQLTAPIADYQSELRRVIAEDLAIVRRQLNQKKIASKKQPANHAKFPAPPRGESHYCAYRPAKKYRAYRANSTRQHCKCGEDHDFIYPDEWRDTPAEADWDYSVPNGGYHRQRSTKVRFVERVVSEVREFEMWYEEEYILSDKYWSKGPVRMSEDESSKFDDDIEAEWCDAMEKWEKSKWAKED
jgi:hypothetical protein